MNQFAVSLLVSQVGYHPYDDKKAYLRSLGSEKQLSIEGRPFFLYEYKTREIKYKGEIKYWGEKWGSHWWVIDFSGCRKIGKYYIDAYNSIKSNEFFIEDMIFFKTAFWQIAIGQLDERLKDFVPGWRDCGTQIRELSSIVITVHALIDIVENKKISDDLTDTQIDDLNKKIKHGLEFIFFAQEHSDDPKRNGRFNHDPARLHSTHDYHMWHDTAYALTALARAALLYKQSDINLYEKCVRCAELGYENAVARPYHLLSELKGREHPNIQYNDDLTDEIDAIGRITYNKDENWHLPHTLRTREKLTFLYACTLLYKATGEDCYKLTSIKFARDVCERQAKIRSEAIEGCYGNFYEFEGDNESCLMEWDQNAYFYMGNIEPTEMGGLIHLLEFCPEHDDAAMWMNAICTYAGRYVIPASNLSPFGIYPLAAYKDPKYGGIKFFQVTNHGATALYGQSANNIMRLARFLNDAKLQTYANNNIEFVAGLNPGFPNSYNETKWEAISLIKGLGVNSFSGAHDLNDIPEGSGMNGFSASAQFHAQPISKEEDGPRGILQPDNSYYFNEDYLPHSHGYIRGVCALENDFTLVVSCKNNGRKIKAYIRVYDKSADKVVFEKSTDSVVINDIVPYSTILVTVKIKHKVYTHEFEAVSGGNKKIIIDICKSLEAMWEAPHDVLCKERFTARLILKNTSISDMHVKAKITADGITIDKKIIDIILGENKTKKLEIEAKSADYAGDYMLYAFFPESYNVNSLYYHGRIIQTDKKSNKISVIDN